jgi:hypothetical protein
MGTIELYGSLAQTPTGHLLFPHTFQQRSSRGPETGFEEIAFPIYLVCFDCGCVIAGAYVDVSQHVDDVSRRWRQSSQPVGPSQGTLREHTIEAG